MFYVYILLNPQGKIYIGQTSHIKERLIEHNETGHGYTAKHRPWKLVHSEQFQSRSQAMQREKYLKSVVGREWITQHILRG